jgi:Tol biopolymer transport system component
VTGSVEAPTSTWVMPVEAAHSAADTSGMPSVDTGRARQINVTNVTGASPFEGSARLSWTPNGRIVYMSEESGNADIWSMRADGSDRKQLTSDPHWDTGPNVSPDGRYIVFMSNRTGTESIWRMGAEGENQKRLTSRFIERGPAFSADSQWVYFVSWETGKGTIWKILVEGGEPTQVIADLAGGPEISPDGTLLLYSRSGKILISPSAGGPPVRSFENRGGRYQWAPGGRAVTFLWQRDQVTNLWAQPLDGGEPRQLTNFTIEGIRFYAWSRDGKQLAVARGTMTCDVVLIRDAK